MGTNATPAQILDAFSAYEMAEMATPTLTGGLVAAYGSAPMGPDAVPGQFPFAMGWITKGRFEPDAEGGVTVQGKYLITRWYVVGTDQDTETQTATKALVFMENPSIALARHRTLGGTVQQVRMTQDWQLTGHVIGDQMCFGVEYTFEVWTLSDRVTGT